MAEYYDGYSVSRIVYALTKYDGLFREMWEDFVAQRLITDYPSDRDSALSALKRVRDTIDKSKRYRSTAAIDAFDEMIDLISRNVYEKDPILPIAVARKHYYRIVLSRSYSNGWNYFYPATEEEVSRLKLPYDNFPVLASEQSREYVRVMSQDIYQYVCTLDNYARRIERSVSLDELLAVLTNADGVVRQMSINSMSIEHNSNVRKLMMGLHLLSRSTTESPYTVICNSIVLSQTTYESNVYLTSVGTDSGTIAMINKVNKSTELYGPFYEYIVGSMINRQLTQIPGFMYTYGYYDGLPPSLVGNVAAVTAYKSNAISRTQKKYYQGFFQYLQNSVTLHDFIMTPTYQIMLGSRLLSHEDSVLFLCLLLLNNVVYMNGLTGLVHGDLHFNNVLITMMSGQEYIPVPLLVDSEFKVVSMLSNAYVYVIDYGFASIRVGEERIYSKTMPIPIPHYAEDSTQDVHSILLALAVRMAAANEKGVVSLESVKFCYDVYSTLFTGQYRKSNYTDGHYPRSIRILYDGQKYCMPQDTVYTLAAVRTYNDFMISGLSLDTNALSAETVFNTDVQLSTDQSMDTVSLYLLNMARSVLSTYYDSISRSIAVNNELTLRLQQTNVQNDWKSIVQSLSQFYASLQPSSRATFLSNNKQRLRSVLRSDAEVEQLFYSMYSYAYHLRIRTVLLALSSFYSIDTALIADEDTRLLQLEKTINDRLVGYISSNSNRLFRLKGTVSLSNLLQFAYGTYNGYMIEQLDTLEVEDF